MRVAFAGSLAARLADPMQASLSLPCEVIVDDEAGIIPRLGRLPIIVERHPPRGPLLPCWQIGQPRPECGQYRFPKACHKRAIDGQFVGPHCC
jgi:hypothetical protein